MSINALQLGCIIKNLRLSLGITQKELAEQTGLTINYISLFENRKRRVSFDALNKIADVLGIPAEIITILAAEIDANSENVPLAKNIQKVARDAVDLYMAL